MKEKSREEKLVVCSSAVKLHGLFFKSDSAIKEGYKNGTLCLFDTIQGLLALNSTLRNKELADELNVPEYKVEHARRSKKGKYWKKA
jgi:hypothetical protein